MGTHFLFYLVGGRMAKSVKHKNLLISGVIQKRIRGVFLKRIKCFSEKNQKYNQCMHFLLPLASLVYIKSVNRPMFTCDDKYICRIWTKGQVT